MVGLERRKPVFRKQRINHYASNQRMVFPSYGPPLPVVSSFKVVHSTTDCSWWSVPLSCFSPPFSLSSRKNQHFFCWFMYSINHWASQSWLRCRLSSSVVYLFYAGKKHIFRPYHITGQASKCHFRGLVTPYQVQGIV